MTHGCTRRGFLLAIAAGLAGCSRPATVTSASTRTRRPPTTSTPLPVRLHPISTLADLGRAGPTQVALTLDDGPSLTWTSKFLDLLRAQQVRATFSLVGENVDRLPHLAQRIVDDGHHVINHSYTHPEPFTRLPPASIDAQIDHTQAAIAAATGVTPGMFRAPGGGWDRKVMTAVASRGLLPLGWSVDPRDWARPGTNTIMRRLERAHPGDILLCHDGGGNRSQTLAALTRLLPQLKARGLQFITL